MTRLWGDKRYNSINYFLKQKFGEKVFKVSIDAGFTCPNRDGRISTGGCIFCSEHGSGDFTGSSKNIVEQFYEGKAILNKKQKSGKFIAYFQAFTNTYGDIDTLREKYFAALNIKDVCGIAIATRPDCLSHDVLELLKEINEKTFLWVELGLQTSNDKTADIINRGYKQDVYMEAINNLNMRGIKTVTHIIFGLPGENKNDMLKTVDLVANTGSWGIKFHLLYLMKGTKLEELYKKGEFKFLEQNEYINLIINSIERIPGDMIIHRLTGDSPRNLLVGPMWSLKKWEVLNSINAGLIDRDTWQGKYYEMQNLK